MFWGKSHRVCPVHPQFIFIVLLGLRPLYSMCIHKINNPFLHSKRREVGRQLAIEVQKKNEELSYDPGCWLSGPHLADQEPGPGLRSSLRERCKVLLYPSPSFFPKLPFALYLTLKPSQWFWQFVSLSLKEKQRTARPRQVCFVFRGCSPLHRRPFISRVWHPYHTNACPYQQSSRLLVYEIYCFVNTQ